MCVMGRTDHPFPVVDHLAALGRYARSLTRDAEAAEDLVHDALVRAYDRRHSFRPEGDLRRWLFAVLHNTFIDDARRRRAEQGRLDAAAAGAPQASEPDQEHAAEVARVRGAFAALPAEQRAVLHLVVSEGLSYQEAAQVLDLPVGTVMSRLARGRAALRAAPPRQAPRLRIVGGRHDEA